MCNIRPEVCQLSVVHMQVLDFETVQIIGEAFEVDILEKDVARIDDMARKTVDYLDEEDIDVLQPRPPVVVVMGHVDHGKASISHLRSSIASQWLYVCLHCAVLFNTHSAKMLSIACWVVAAVSFERRCSQVHLCHGCDMPHITASWLLQEARANTDAVC